MFQVRILAGSRERATVSGGCSGAKELDSLYRTKLPGMIHCSTEHISG